MNVPSGCGQLSGTGAQVAAWGEEIALLFDREVGLVYPWSMDGGQGVRRNEGIDRFAPLILDCVRDTEKTALQNIVMRMPDKVCAVGLAALSEEQRREVYALIAAPKAARIEEEMRLESRRRTGALVRARIVRTFLSYFGRAPKMHGTIWVRPKRRA